MTDGALGGIILPLWQARRGTNELLSYICEDFLIKVTNFLLKKKKFRCNLRTHDLILGHVAPQPNKYYILGTPQWPHIY